MSLKKIYLLILLPLLFISPMDAQKSDPRQLLTEAEEAYQIGRIEDVIEMLEGKDDNLNSNLKLRAYRLLSLCHLALEDQEMSRMYAVKMLNENPYYTPTVEYPPRFIDLVNEIKIGMDTRITTASNQSESLREAPSPITIITAEMIEEVGYNKNLNQILATYVPGMTEVTSDVPSENMAMHGAFGDKQQLILLMENGHRLNNLFDNSGTMSYNISTEKIDHIEVLRGPASSIYGNVAVSAVVNIITKSGRTVNGGKARYGYGSFGTHRADFLMGTQYMDADIMAWGSIYKSDGQIRHYNDGKGYYAGDVQEDDFFLHDFGPDRLYVDGYKNQPSYDIGFTFRLKGFNLMISRKNYNKLYQNCWASGYDIDLYPNIDGAKPGYGTDATHIDFGYTGTISNVLFNATVFGDLTNMTKYQPVYDLRRQPNYGELEDADSVWHSTGADFTRMKEFTRGVYVNGAADYRLGKMNGNILIGAQYEYFSLQSSVFLSISDEAFETGSYAPADVVNSGKEQSLSFFMQDKHYILPQLILNAGLRYDIKYHNDNDRITSLSPRLALVYAPNSQFNLKLTYSQAFADLCYYYRYLSYDYADLQPQILSAIQLTAMGQVPSLNLGYEVNLYYNKYSNLQCWQTRYDEDEDIIHNNGKFQTIGIEGSARYNGRRWSGNLTVFYSHDIDGEKFYYNSIEKQTNCTPHFTTNLHGAYQLLNTSNHALKVYGTAAYRGKILNYSTYEVFDEYVDRSFRFDLGLKYTYRQRLGLTLDCENLFDADQYICGPHVRRHPIFQRSRTLMASISYKL